MKIGDRVWGGGEKKEGGRRVRGKSVEVRDEEEEEREEREREPERERTRACSRVLERKYIVQG